MDESKSPDTEYVYVQQSGLVMDDRPIHVISSCNMDIYTFPFDIQNCTFTFNSYKLTAGDVQLFFVEPVEVTLYTSLSVMKTKGEWELVNMLSEKPPIPPEELNITYDTLIYYVILSRRPTMYVVNLLIPSCFLITVDLISFLLPPQNVDRSAFKMTLIFGYTVFLLLMNDLLPVTGNNLPLINAFFSLCFALMVASLLETILITNIQCGSINFGPLPRWAKVLFLNYVARLVCLSKKPSDQNCIPEEHRTGTKHCDPEVEGPQRGAAYQTPVTLELKKISHELLSIREQDWMIEGLSWDPVECGTDRITLPRKKLWRPDIVINEFISDNQAPKTYYVYLNNNGKAEDRLPIHVISSCNLDIYTFPFDIQNCTYTFGSYKHTIRDVQLFFSEPVEATLRKSLQYMETKGEWQLTDMIAGKSSNSSYFNMDGLDRWDELVYYIVLKRRPTLYVVNLLIPSYCLITVDLFSFLLPPQNMDRSAFKMTLILGYTVFLLLMNDLLPVTGDTIPLISLFLLPPQSVDHASFKMTLILGYNVFLLQMNDLLPVTGNNLPLIMSCLGNMLRCEEGQSGPTYDSIQEVIDKKPFRPSVNLSTPTITNISLTLYAILGVNEKAQILTTFLWLRLHWFHEFLIWDPEVCDGITRISLPVNDLWTPDVVVYEFVDDDVSQACPYVYVNHTGHIRYDRMLRLVSACNLQIFSFPFDIQNCSFTFGSYMHTIKDIRVSPALSFKEMTENSKRYLQASGEWELVVILGETEILKFGIDEWDIITFWVVIKRRPTLYVVNLIIPSSFLMIIDILSFYLPPHSVDRSSFKMTLILGYTVFLLIMNDLLPSTANGTPLIGIYFSVCLALMTISLMETILITCVLHHNSMKYREVPHWVQVLVIRFIARLICYNFHEDPLGKLEEKHKTNLWVIQPSESTSSQQTSTNASGTMTLDVPELRQISQDLKEMSTYLSIISKEDHLQNQWCHVGYILDFLLFRVYLLIITGYALVIICMWCIWINQ
ncbi:hypothetical protein Q8A67_006211 [Cirrhinus molitorella]|uniref:5-hydroxytryptamine receptor 3A n=1 Tax=Cirrhinus molitorella TaxID=172907 RepID=A0AA88U2W8_9TELE|nr:hypothetical protein Q8A67_006211 [Cirrhinus molitorella]